MKKALAILLVLSIGFNGWQLWAAHGLATTIVQQQQRWGGLQAAKVRMLRNTKTGDIWIQVPYRKEPYLFPKVCGKELSL